MGAHVNRVAPGRMTAGGSPCARVMYSCWEYWPTHQLQAWLTIPPPNYGGGLQPTWGKWQHWSLTRIRGAAGA